MKLGIMSNYMKYNLNKTNISLNDTLQRLSTGLRINKSSDDAFGLAISDKLRTQANGIKQGIDNANSSLAMMSIADKAIDELSKILDTIKAKAIQMNTDTTSEEGREIIKTDILDLIKNYENIVCSTNYNKVPLLTGCASPFVFQVGDKVDDLIKVKVDNLSSSQMGFDEPLRLNNFITGFNLPPEETPTLPSTTPSVIGNVGSGIRLSSDLNDFTTYDSSPQGKFMIEIPAGIKDLTLYLNEFTQDDTIQVFTKDGKHIAGTPANDKSWGFPNSPEKLVQNNLGRYFNANATYKDELNSPSIPNNYYGPFNSYNSYSNTPSNAVNAQYIDKYGDTINKTIREYEEMVVIPDVKENLVVFVNGIGRYLVSAEWRYVTTAQTPTPQDTKQDDIRCGCDDEKFVRNDVDPTLKVQAQMLMDVVDKALSQLNTQRGNIGTGINQVESVVRSNMKSYTNLKESESILRDVDYAKESSNFVKLDIQAKAGSFSISQANFRKDLVMQLLR